MNAILFRSLFVGSILRSSIYYFKIILNVHRGYVEKKKDKQTLFEIIYVDGQLRRIGDRMIRGPSKIDTI